MSRKWLTVMILAALALCLAAPSCFPISPTPTGSGGAPAAGGAVATGGSLATGGDAATGGTTVAALAPPVCDATRELKSRAQMPVTGWHRNPHRAQLLAQHAKSVAPFAATGPVWWPSVLPGPLDQGSVGACTGFAAAGASAMLPFGQMRTNQGGFDAYHWATWHDQGCAWDAKTCPGAWPPNDIGSYGSSALDAAVHLGWFRSWSAIGSVSELIQRLQRGPCLIGSTWYESQFSPSNQEGSCGKMTIGGAVAGGHERAIAGYFIVDGEKRFVEQNSWGHWGACDPARPSWCAYAYLVRKDLESLVASGDAELDCPDVP